MKNFLSTFLFTFLFVFCIQNNVLATNFKQLITTLTVNDNDSIFHYQYLYNLQGNISLETKYYDQDGSWIRKTQTEWVYDSGNCTTQWERIWNNGWINTFSINYTYDNGLLSSEIQTSYKNGVILLLNKISYQYINSLLKTKSTDFWKDKSWIMYQLENFSYYPNLKTDSIMTVNYGSGSMQNQFLSVFTYNTDGTLESQLLQQKTGDGNWINSELINWFYTPVTKQVQSQRNKIWNDEFLNWENSQKLEYQYDTESKLLSETCFNWKTMFWENVLQFDYKYDSTGLLTHKILSLPIYNKWRGITTIDYSDFVLDKANLMESKLMFWGGNSGNLVSSYIPFLFNDEITVRKGESLEISYIPLYDTKISEIENSKNTVYPNPSNGMYYLKTPDSKINSWTVTDLDGRFVKNQVQLNQSNVIDIMDLPKGIYVLHVFTQNKDFTEKLIKN